MIRIVEDMRDVNIYLSLRKQVGWIKLDENQAQRALDNSYRNGKSGWRYGCNKLYTGFNNNTGISE